MNQYAVLRFLALLVLVLVDTSELLDLLLEAVNLVASNMPISAGRCSKNASFNLLKSARRSLTGVPFAAHSAISLREGSNLPILVTIDNSIASSPGAIIQAAGQNLILRKWWDQWWGLDVASSDTTSAGGWRTGGLGEAGGTGLARTAREGIRKAGGRRGTDGERFVVPGGVSTGVDGGISGCLSGSVSGRVCQGERRVCGGVQEVLRNDGLVTASCGGHGDAEFGLR